MDTALANFFFFFLRFYGTSKFKFKEIWQKAPNLAIFTKQACGSIKDLLQGQNKIYSRRTEGNPEHLAFSGSQLERS